MAQATVADWIVTHIQDVKTLSDHKRLSQIIEFDFHSPTSTIRPIFESLADNYGKAIDQMEKGVADNMIDLMVSPAHRMNQVMFFVPVALSDETVSAASLEQFTIWQMNLDFEQQAQLRKDLIVGGLVNAKEVYLKSQQDTFGEGDWNPAEPTGFEGSDGTIASAQYQAFDVVAKTHFLTDEAEELFKQRQRDLASGAPLTPTISDLALQAHELLIADDNVGQSQGLSQSDLRSLYYAEPKTDPQSKATHQVYDEIGEQLSNWDLARQHYFAATGRDLDNIADEVDSIAPSGTQIEFDL